MRSLNDGSSTSTSKSDIAFKPKNHAQEAVVTSSLLAVLVNRKIPVATRGLRLAVCFCAVES